MFKYRVAYNSSLLESRRSLITLIDSSKFGLAANEISHGRNSINIPSRINDSSGASRLSRGKIFANTGLTPRDNRERKREGEREREEERG